MTPCISSTFDSGAIEIVSSNMSDGAADFDSVVVTAGAWAKGLLETAGVDLDVRPTRETVAYFEMAGAPPPTLVEWGEGLAEGLAEDRLEVAITRSAGGDAAPEGDEVRTERLTPVGARWVGSDVADLVG